MSLRFVMVLVLVAACEGGATETTVESTATLPPIVSTTTRRSPSTTAPTTTAAMTTTAVTNLIQVAGGAKVRGPDTISVTQGEIVTFQVVADVADEVHVHGYDLSVETLPGQPVTVQFTADATGIFEVELEGNHLGLVNIEVTP